MPKTASENDSQKLAGLANNTSINNNKTQTSTGDSQSEQVQTETAKVNKVSDKIVSTVNESKAEVTNSSTLNENNPETADLSGFDNSSYTNKLKSFRVDKKVIRTVILNKPTGRETVTMSLEIYVSPRMTSLHMPDGKSGYNYFPVVMSEITTSNEKEPLSKSVLPEITFKVVDNEFVTQQDKENYEKFMSVNTDNISLQLPAFAINDIDVPGYSHQINKQKSNSQNIGAESFQPYTDTPQTVVIDYTRDVEGDINKKVTEIIDKLINNQMTTEPARTVILKKPTGNQTIIQKADIRGAIKTKVITGAGPNEKTREVYIAPYVEPNKPSSKYQKKYSITFDSDTGQIISGQDDYDQLMALKRSDFKVDLPAIDTAQFDVPGYTWKITSATPAGAGLGAETYTFGNPQTIIIDYTKEQKHTVTYKFEDPFNNQVGDSVSVSGEDGSNQSVNLTLPDGYQLASGSLPTSVTIPDSDKTISIPVKHQLTINLSGESTIDYASYDWQNLVKNKELSASAYTAQFNDKNARAQLTDGDVMYDGNGNVGTYKVSLTEQGLEDLKQQLGDNFIYPDFKDVTSDARLIIEKGHKEIDLMGGDTKVFDNTSTLPDQGTFYSGLGLGVDDQGKISIYNSDGTLKTIQLTPNDVEFWLNGKKVTKDQAKSVGTYDLRLTDAFIQKVKDADGNNGNNYEWTYGPEYETARYVIYQATGKAKLSGDNSKLYDGNAVTTAEVNKDGKITIDLTLPVYKQADEPGEEPQLLRTVDLGKYTLQDGDYTWANGTAPTKGGIYTINLNKDKILAHLQDRLVDLAGMGTDPDDSTKSLSNVTITADDMDGQAAFTINTTVTYQFVDDDNKGSVVGNPVVATGLNGKSQSVHLTVPEAEGYVLASGQSLPTSVTFGDTNTTVDIHLKHGITTVTPDKPGTPGQPIDPKNPDGPKYPTGTDKDSLQSIVTRTITVKNPHTGDQVTNQTAKLTRTATVDEVTGKVTYSDWVPGAWDNYDVPAVSGYTPSQNKVPQQLVTVGTKDTTVTITYTPNDQTGKISYVDPTGKEVGTTPLTGKTDEEVTINPVAPTGWKIVDGQSVPKTEKATPTGIATVTVKVEHKTTTVQPTDPKTPSDKLPDNPDKAYPDGVGEKDLNKTIVRKITVVKPDGTKESHDQSVKLTRTATVDEVTGKVIGYSDWTTENFGEYDAPVIPGYTPSQAKVEGVKVTADSSFTPVEITYTPNAQKTTVTYIDKDGNPISHYEVDGHTDETVPTKAKDNVPTGWHITDPKATDEITFTPNGYPAITVHVDHDTTTVQPTDPKTPSDKLPDNPDKHYPDGVGEKDLNKTVKRTITVKKPDGSTVDASQETTLTRTATVDEVTGQVTYGKWTTSKLGKYNAPEIPGYTPSQAEVPAVDQVTVDYTDPKIEITYTPNAQTGKITYVDPNGKEVGTTPLTGKTDEEIPVTPNVPAGWQIVPGQDIPTMITATPNGIPTVTVNVEHKIVTVTPTDSKTPSDKLPDNPGKNYPKGVDTTDLNKTITRKITVIKPDGTKEAHDQTVNLTRTATVDEVTGKVTGYSDWTTSSFAEYDAPEIPGYTPSGNAPAVALVTSTSDFTPIVITYIPTDQTVKYKFVDPQGKVVGVQTVPGKTGQTVPVNIHIPDGYQLVPGESVPTSYTFKDGNPDQIIKVALIPTTNGGQPTTDDHQGQGTPATNTPTNTTPNKNDVTGKLEGNVPNVQTGKTMTSQSTTAKDKQLPQTGNTGEKNAQIFGALSAGLAALVAGFVPNRRRDNK